MQLNASEDLHYVLFTFGCFTNNQSLQNKNIAMIIQKQMGGSLTPWDYETEPSKQIYHRQKSLASKVRVVHRYNSQGTRLRVVTSQKSRIVQRDVIKLQERVPTETVNIVDWQVELKPLGFLKNQLVIKIPNQFATLPHKKHSEIKRSASTLPKYQSNTGMSRQKISFRNFKKEIEELDRLKTSKKVNLDFHPRPKSKGLLKMSDNFMNHTPYKSFQRCSLKNMNPFDDPEASKQIQSAMKQKGNENDLKKRHILDSLLSKFQ